MWVMTAYNLVDFLANISLFCGFLCLRQLRRSG